MRSNDVRWQTERNHLAERGIVAEPFNGFAGEASGLVTLNPYEVDHPGSGHKITQKCIGVCLSHYMLWAALLVSGEDMAFVIEDDALFDADWQPKIESAMTSIPDDWDMLYVGSCCAEKKPKTHVAKNLYEVKYPLCTHAYMVRRKALPVLLEHMQKVWAPVDLAMFFGPLPHLRVYTILPSPVKQRDTTLEP